MFVEVVKTDGLAHLSYLLGDGGEAAVIDPRRDCEFYAERAQARGCRITNIIETHCNEDLISGAPVLAELTGAPVHHGPNPLRPVSYAGTVRDGQTFNLGKLGLKVLETPGHTDDSLSIAIYDRSFGDDALGVFTGDALFVGDVGRTDFYPERAEEVAGLLYDSLRRIEALGDQALVYPAHGAGSVCGLAMADRDFSTIGYERRNNPMLQIKDRASFIERKLAEHHDKPPYFQHMERLNLDGAGPLALSAGPPALQPEAFRERQGAIAVDVRGVGAWLGAHPPDSLALPVGMLAAFAGWLLDPDDELVLVADDAAQATTAARHLGRMGYDRVHGYLAAAMPAWAAAGRTFRSVPAVDVEEVAHRVEARPNGWTLLDVRSVPEVEQGIVAGARPVFLGELPRRLDALPRGQRYTVMCGSGARATIAASVLLRAGFAAVDVFMGSMGAWTASGRETVPAG